MLDLSFSTSSSSDDEYLLPPFLYVHKGHDLVGDFFFSYPPPELFCFVLFLYTYRIVSCYIMSYHIMYVHGAEHRRRNERFSFFLSSLFSVIPTYLLTNSNVVVVVVNNAYDERCAESIYNDLQLGSVVHVSS